MTANVERSKDTSVATQLLREIMRLQSLRTGWDIVVIARPAVVNTDYHQLKQEVSRLLNRAELLENKNGSISSGFN